MYLLLDETESRMRRLSNASRPLAYSSASRPLTSNGARVLSPPINTMQRDPGATRKRETEKDLIMRSGMLPHQGLIKQYVTGSGRRSTSSYTPHIIDDAANRRSPQSETCPSPKSCRHTQARPTSPQSSAAPPSRLWAMALGAYVKGSGG